MYCESARRCGLKNEKDLLESEMLLSGENPSQSIGFATETLMDRRKYQALSKSTHERRGAEETQNQQRTGPDCLQRFSFAN